MLDVDITGLASRANKDWEARAQDLCKAEFFEVSIVINPELYHAITDDEWERLDHKLKFVEQFARYMAAGMMKGIIKYKSDTDGKALENWFADLVGESADIANYQMLAWDKFKRDQDATK